MEDSKELKHSVIVWGADGERRKDLDKHYTETAKPQAVAYANSLLKDGYKARLYPYRKPVSAIDYIAQEGPPGWLRE